MSLSEASLRHTRCVPQGDFFANNFVPQNVRTASTQHNTNSHNGQPHNFTQCPGESNAPYFEQAQQDSLARQETPADCRRVDAQGALGNTNASCERQTHNNWESQYSITVSY